MAHSEISMPNENDECDPSIKALEQSNHDLGMRTFCIRFWISTIMTIAYMMIVVAGGFYRVLLVRIIITCIYREIAYLRRNQPDVVSHKFYFTQRYILYSLQCLATLGDFLPTLARSFQYSFPNLPENILQGADFIARNQNVIHGVIQCFTLVLWILTLRSVAIKEQMKQALFLWGPGLALSTVELHWWKIQLHGAYWAWMGAGAVICNDISGYVVGKIWGKTPLLRISPRKTVEGFIGAVIVTYIVMGLKTLFPYYLPGMLCPDKTMYLNPVTNIRNLQESCELSEHFLAPKYTKLQSLLPILSLVKGMGQIEIKYNNLLVHTMIYATFASFIAPFGGLLASAVKRAMNIKDFGTTFSKHGGFLDRFDCQIVAGLFLAMYLDYVVGRVYFHFMEIDNVLSNLSNLAPNVKREVLAKIIEALST